MGFKDLAAIVDGSKTDDICMKPFTRHFTTEKILRSWAKVGFCPFTRNCVKNKKVRRELGQQQRDNSLEDLQASYETLANSAKEHGLNAGIFGRIPVAKQMKREADEDDQIKKLLATRKGAFSALGLWMNCGTRIGNASVVLRAQKEQLELDAKKIALQSQAKSQQRVKLLLSSQQALQKNENAPASMIDKDWIDIIQWMLPESNADGLLKDLRKRMSFSQNLCHSSEIEKRTFQLSIQFRCSSLHIDVLRNNFEH